jgi:rSAM/selenodomain-associated transferase 2
MLLAAMISIVIPTFNEAHRVEAFLRRLLRQSGDLQVIVADGGSEDGTWEILSRFPQVERVFAARGRGNQMNEGAKVAQGEILLFLHADTALPPRGPQKIREVLADRAVIGGSFSLCFDHPGLLFRILALGSRINHTYFTYGDQGLFLRALTFKKIGGFRNIPVMEDLEIQKRLRGLGRFVKIPDPVLTSARRYLQNGPLRQHLLTTTLVSLFHLGVSPQTLARYYPLGRSPEWKPLKSQPRE